MRNPRPDAPRAGQAANPEPARPECALFPALRCPVERVKDPAFQLRVPREGEREFRVELDGPLVKLLALFQFVEFLKSAGKIVRLDKSQIGFAILGGFALYSRLFGG